MSVIRDVLINFVSGYRPRTRQVIALIAVVGTVALTGLSPVPAQGAASRSTDPVLPFRQCYSGITPTAPLEQKSSYKSLLGDQSRVTLTNLNDFAGATGTIDIGSNHFSFVLGPALNPLEWARHRKRKPNRFAKQTFALPAQGNKIRQLPQENGFSIEVLSDAAAVEYRVESTMCQYDEAFQFYGGGPFSAPLNGKKNGTITIQMGRPVKKSVSATYRTVDGSAKEGVDYESRSGSLYFKIGEQFKAIEIPILGNSNGAGSKTFSLEVTADPPSDISPGVSTAYVVNSHISIPLFINSVKSSPAIPVFQLHKDGSVWQSTGERCADAKCYGWFLMDNNRATTAIVTGAGKLFQLHKDGSIWQSTGERCAGANKCDGWYQLDNNPATTAIVTGAGKLFQLQKNGSIWQSTGAPCSAGPKCYGWSLMDNNRATTAIATGAGKLFQLHKDGSIWQSTGERCAGANKCDGWYQLDNNPATTAIVTGAGKLFQLQKNGSIWQSTGAPCSAGPKCYGWSLMDNNRATTAIATGAGKLFQLHKDGSIWQSTGERCAGANKCDGWYQLDNNPATTAIVTGAGKLFQLQKNGSIWQSTGAPCSAGPKCYGWSLMDNNRATAVVTAGDDS